VCGPCLPSPFRKEVLSSICQTVALGLGDRSVEQALGVVPTLGGKGDGRTVEAVVGALLRGTETVAARCAALRVLREISSRGDPVAIDALVTALKDKEVQLEVLQTMEVLCNGEHSEVRVLVDLALNESVCSSVRCCSIQCLSQLAHRGCKSALNCAIEAMRSGDSNLRSAALGLVMRVAEPGCTAGKALVVAHLGDSDLDVCRKAMDACEALGIQGDVHVISALVAHVVSGEFCLRQMSLRTIQHLFRAGDPAIVSAILPVLDRGHWPQRHAALEALTVVSEHGNTEVLSVVLRHLDDADLTCRQTACRALGELAIPGDHSVMRALFKLMEDRNWLIRDAAGEALTQVVTRKDVEFLEGLAASADAETKEAVRAILSSLCAEQTREIAVSSQRAAPL